MYKLMTILIAAAVLAGLSEGRYTPYNRYNQPYNRPVPAPVAPAPAPLVRGGYYPGPGAQAYTLRQDQEIDDNTGSYHYGYETSNGIRAEERATLQAYGPEQGTKSAEGSYSYTSPEGIPIQVSYVADENGFRAVGAHIPTPPPIPEAIQRALAYNAAHPYEETEYREPYRRYPATPARYY